MNPNIPSPLYEVQYKPGGTKYTYRFDTLKNRFRATEEEVHAAIVVAMMGERVPDGPLKGLFIRPMSPSEGEAIQRAYKRKVEEHKPKLIIGTVEDIW